MARDHSPSERFRAFAEKTSAALGSVQIFLAAFAFVLLWGITGPLFSFSDTWQLTMNTVASIVAFLMVFVIQNTQYRDTRAVHLKLDELIRALEGARKDMVHLEDLPDGRLKALHDEFEQLHDDIEREAAEAHDHDERGREERGRAA